MKEEEMNEKHTPGEILNEEMEAAPQDQEKAEKTAAKSEDTATDNSDTIKSEQEIAELKDKYLRLYAEFDNFKKRSIREKLELMKTASQDTLSALLPVLDDFDRAKKSADDKNTEEEFSEGVTLVYAKLYRILKTLGLEAMESDGKSFDPELHEAISEIPVPGKKQKGKVIDTIEQGYILREKIIRHAKVVVGR